jgi:hypothetical protein
LLDLAAQVATWTKANGQRVHGGIASAGRPRNFLRYFASGGIAAARNILLAGDSLDDHEVVAQVREIFLGGRVVVPAEEADPKIARVATPRTFEATVPSFESPDRGHDPSLPQASSSIRIDDLGASRLARRGQSSCSATSPRSRPS